MKELGDKIAKALTEQQMAELINTVWQVISEEQCDEVLEIVSKPVSTTINEILNSKASVKVVPSDDKLQLQWNAFELSLYKFTSVLGDEDGRYILNDRHWEQPEFMYETFGDDVEQLFKTVAPSISEYVKSGVIDESYVFEFADEISDGLDLLPEWMGLLDCYENITLQENTTNSLLQILLDSSESIGELMTWLFDLEHKLEYCSFDSGTFLNFFFEKLSDTQRTMVREYLTSNDLPKNQKKRVVSEHSDWHQLLKELSAQHRGYTK